MGFAVVGLLCGLGGVLLAALVAGSLLRLAVSVSNRVVGPQTPSPGGIAEWDWDDWDDEYSAPARTRRGSKTIPEPGLGKCTVIVFVTALGYVLGFVLLMFAAEELLGLRVGREDAQLVVALFALPVGDLALCVLLFSMLPTTFWRAAMVTFVYNLILLGVGLGISAFLFVLTALLG
jgi:hypothetical protein